MKSRFKELNSIVQRFKLQLNYFLTTIFIQSFNQLTKLHYARQMSFTSCLVHAEHHVVFTLNSYNPFRTFGIAYNIYYNMMMSNIALFSIQKQQIYIYSTIHFAQINIAKIIVRTQCENNTHDVCPYWYYDLKTYRAMHKKASILHH